jgi:hypothetical protein
MNSAMNRNIYLSVLAAALMCLAGCEDDFETVPLEQNTIDFVFSRTDSLGEAAKLYLNSVYSQMQSGHNRVGGDYLDAATDDAISSSIDNAPDVERLINGAYTASNAIGSEMRWEALYAGIRTASTFVTHIGRVPLKAKAPNGISMNAVWRSEARFIRALHYFDLVKRYGGVPLMGDHVRQLGEDVELPRNTFEECINYIVGECDAIKDSLRVNPVADPEINGHVVTRAAALALKARVLLYAASPLFNGENIDPGNPLTGYTNYDAARWQRAAQAAQDVIALNTFSLLGKFNEVFTAEGNAEVIFFRSNGENTNVESDNGPVGFSGVNLGRGRLSPTQNLVDAFPMKNGLPIADAASGYNPADPYTNRDPRLSLTVLYNGSAWLGSPLQTFEGGRSKPGGLLQQTKTSYYLRKFMGDFAGKDRYENTPHDWIMFRYAEILLNFAEAENEFAGPTPEVYKALTDLRGRAGITAGADNLYGLKASMTKEEMRQAIRTERRIEMAFEEQRYWDIRRWKIADELTAAPFQGLLIINSGGTISYSRVNVFTPAPFTEKRYLYPIPYDEVIENERMVQNPGW